MRNYSAERREELRLKAKEHYLRNRERISTERKRRYRNDPDFRAKAIAQSNKYRLANADKCRERKRKYVAEHLEENRKRANDYYYKNYEQCSRKMAVRRTLKRNEMRAWSRDRSLNLTDGYVREMLSKFSTISAHEWPQELVDAKRLEIMCMRLTGDKRYKSLPETKTTQTKP